MGFKSVLYMCIFKSLFFIKFKLHAHLLCVNVFLCVWARVHHGVCVWRAEDTGGQYSASTWQALGIELGWPSLAEGAFSKGAISLPLLRFQPAYKVTGLP